MKNWCVFLFLVGASLALKPLSYDLLEFVFLIPPETNDIVAKYENDSEFIAVSEYVYESEEFKSIVTDMESIPEFIRLLNYLEDSGVEMYGYINMIHQIVGLPPFYRPGRNQNNEKLIKVNQPLPILVQIRNEVRTTLPRDKIDILHKDKLKRSPEFAYFAKRLEDPELDEILNDLKANKKFKWDYSTLYNNGIDLNDSALFYLQLFGFRDL